MSGPVAPLYLNLEEVEQLLLAVSLLERLSSHMTSPETEELATLIIAWKEGQGAVGRLDQTLAAARERLPVLRSLSTALAELGHQLRRTGDDDG